MNDPRIGTLKIRDLEFEIVSASLVEVFSGDSRAWDFHLWTKQRMLFDAPWAPDISGERIAVAAPPLSQIVGNSVEIPLAYNHETDEYLVTMYVFSHNEVYDSVLDFLERDGSRLLIRWNGKCTIRFGEDYGEDIPFVLKAWFETKDS